MKIKKSLNITKCPVTHCMSVVGGKWKTIIIFLVSLGVNRFGLLKRSAQGISKQMLTSQLRELEADGILDRKIYAEIPPRVEYSLTPKGATLLEIIESMRKWGEANMVK